MGISVSFEQATCRAILFLLIAAASLSAQTSPFADLHGELQTEGNVRQNMGLRVELRDAHGDVAAAVTAAPDGRFSVSGLAAGDYELIVFDTNRQEIARQHLNARAFTSGVAVNVPGTSAEHAQQAPAGGAVSVGALQHRPDHQAVSLQKKAIAAHERHDHGRTVELLRQALERDPLFASAHYLLGVEYALNGDFATGAKELGRAVELDGSSAAAESAYAVVLLHLHEGEQALVHAARAVQLDPQSPKCLYTLGVALVDTGHASQALPYLRQAASGMPEAGQLASKVEQEIGRN
jgi:cytochrome c-type biogenesis protein CcmH/NrfG